MMASSRKPRHQLSALPAVICLAAHNYVATYNSFPSGALYPCSVVDFGIGNQTYKRSWCPVETVQYDLFLPISGMGHLAAMAQRGITRTKAAIKSNRKLYVFIQRMRARRGTDAASADDSGGDGD